MEVEWSRLKARELAELARRNAIVLVPIGATEQHGPHLPVQVDARLAGEVCVRAARIVAKHEPIATLPSIWFGMSEHHMKLGGTITLDFETMYAVVRCVVRSLLQHGFKRIFILNGHGGNTTALENIVGELTIKHQVPLACGTYWDIAADAIAGLLEKQKRLLHACEAETSMMLALTPELIDRNELSQMHGPYVPGLSAIDGANKAAYRWRYLSTRSPNGVIGDASAASPEKGEKLLSAIAEELAKALMVKEFWAAPV
ncbi:MAG: creatininase family protein [Alphaproteobacteria bacterium]|nr:creatininase family protein [Alphaproteobacteria bacterium]